MGWGIIKEDILFINLNEMKYLLWLALLIAVVVIVNEFAYIGQTSLAWVVIALSVAVGAVAIYLMAEKK